MFWDGTRWVAEEAATRRTDPARQARPRSLLALAIVAGLLLALPLQTLAATKTGATLNVVFSTAPTAGSTQPVPYTVTGCGYSAANGGVTVVVQSPQAISFAGQIPDANGCIAVSNFSTQGSGTYDLTSYQTIRHKSQVMAKTSFTLP